MSNSEYQREWCTNSYFEALSLVQAGRTRLGERTLTLASDEHVDLFFEHCMFLYFYMLRTLLIPSY